MFKYRSIRSKFYIALLLAWGLQLSALAITHTINTDYNSIGDKNISLPNTFRENQTKLRRSTQQLSNSDLDSIDGDRHNRDMVRIIRIISISLFSLIFVSFGIFYPFFLFYKKLLNTDTDYKELDTESSHSSQNIESEDLSNTTSLESNTDRATLSKLQIAIAPESGQLQQELANLNFSVDDQTDREIMELMRKTISLILIEQDRWTHADLISIPVAVNVVKTQLDVICAREKSKLIADELDIVTDKKRSPQPDKPPPKKSGYIVITLILCTCHTNFIVDEILTRKQLHETLTQLGKIPQNHLIEFELLYNPVLEDELLTNHQLLRDYGDLMRLF